LRLAVVVVVIKTTQDLVVVAVAGAVAVVVRARLLVHREEPELLARGVTVEVLQGIQQVAVAVVVLGVLDHLGQRLSLAMVELEFHQASAGRPRTMAVAVAVVLGQLPDLVVLAVEAMEQTTLAATEATEQTTAAAAAEAGLVLMFQTREAATVVQGSLSFATLRKNVDTVSVKVG
jgi:hypothetical protein